VIVIGAIPLHVCDTYWNNTNYFRWFCVNYFMLLLFCSMHMWT